QKPEEERSQETVSATQTSAMEPGVLQNRRSSVVCTDVGVMSCIGEARRSASGGTAAAASGEPDNRHACSHGQPRVGNGQFRMRKGPAVSVRQSDLRA